MTLFSGTIRLVHDNHLDIVCFLCVENGIVEGANDPTLSPPQSSRCQIGVQDFVIASLVPEFEVANFKLDLITCSISTRV